MTSQEEKINIPDYYILKCESKKYFGLHLKEMSKITTNKVIEKLDEKAAKWVEKNGGTCVVAEAMWKTLFEVKK